MEKASLTGDAVAGSFAASTAVVETVFAETYIELSLAKDAVLFAFTTFFDLLTLVAANLGFGGHEITLTSDRLRAERSVGNQKQALGFRLQALAT